MTVQEPFKKPRPPRVPPLLYILLAMALLALPRPLLYLPGAILPPAPSPPAPSRPLAPAPAPARECGHVVLVSAARHGSTWLLDSAEGCHSVNGSYGRVNRLTELWNAAQPGPLQRISPLAAARYARANHSVKVFPPALDGAADIAAFFAAVARDETPVFVLRRRLEDSYDSLATARKTKNWTSDRGTVQDVGERRIVKDGKWEVYYSRMESYFEEVGRVMKASGVVWDELRYEHVIGMTRILGRRNACYIRNCNFRS